MLNNGSNEVEGVPVEVVRKRIRRINIRVAPDGRLEGLDPKGVDLVVVAGDFGIMKGWGAWHLYAQVEWVNTRLAEWCASCPKTQFRFVPGNHDLFAEQPGLLSEVRLPENAKPLIDESYEVWYEPFVFDL